MTNTDFRGAVVRRDGHARHRARLRGHREAQYVHRGDVGLRHRVGGSSGGEGVEGIVWHGGGPIAEIALRRKIAEIADPAIYRKIGGPSGVRLESPRRGILKQIHDRERPARIKSADAAQGVGQFVQRVANGVIFPRDALIVRVEVPSSGTAEPDVSVCFGPIRGNETQSLFLRQ